MSNSEDGLVQYSNYLQAAASFFDKFDRYECQEILSYSSAHWLLSTDVFRASSGSVHGMVSSISPKENAAVILFPVNSAAPPLCYREVHNIVRELTLAIYVFNQTPVLTLEANFDQATVCNMPPAYLDTRVGQLMTNVDYMLKSLWHGAYFPREKRLKFAERWREILDVNMYGKPETRKPLLTEFQTAGLKDITADPDYAHVYDEVPEDIPNDTEVAVERQFFLSHVDDLAMNLTFSQDKVEYCNEMYIVNSNYHVSSIVHLLDTVDNIGFERLKMRLQMHEKILQEHLASKQETRRQLELLKLISYLVPFFLGMRKRMKIPDIQKLLPPLNSEKCRTEREFPPLIVGPDFKCKDFRLSGQYFHLHGGISFDIETDAMLQATETFRNQYDDVMHLAVKELSKHMHLDTHEKDHYNIPVTTIDGKSYYAIVIEFETFYGISPHKPLWVRAFTDEIEKIRPIRLPITEIHMHEQFKKHFGVKKAIKYKTPAVGIQICAKRGMLSMFNVLCRKVSGSKLGIGKQDEQGLSLLHYAAMYNRPQIIGRLLLNSVDVNVCRNISGTGPTALHFAARCGSLDAVSCLLCNQANMLAVDQNGWAPIHHAAFFDHPVIVKLLVRRNTDLLDLMTKNELRSTPLLLAATSGALFAVKCFIELKAEIRATDLQGNNLISLAALHFHTNVLEYLIELNHPYASVWNILVEMLSDPDIVKKNSAVKCLEVLSTSKPDNWKYMLAAGIIRPLISILQIDDEELHCVAASVMCNMSEHEPVKIALTNAEALPSLIKLLSSPIDDIQSRTAVILTDMASIEKNKTVFAENGGIKPLVLLLDSEMEDVLVNVVNAIRVMCQDHYANQIAVAKCRGLEPLIEFLSIASSQLQAGAAAALAAVLDKNPENQKLALDLSAGRPLVELVKTTRSVTSQVKASRAIEAFATNNAETQKCFLELDAPKALIRLLKNQHVEVREQGACTLWSLSGNTKTQQRYIAERITVSHIIQMLLEPTEKLLYVGCMMAIALGTENMENQNKLAAAEAFSQLIRLLRSPKTSEKILHMVVKVVGILCLGVAYKNNIVTQHKIAEEGGISVLTNLLLNAPSKEIQVEVAITLGCVTLSCKENQEKLMEEPDFSFDILLTMLRVKDPEIQLRAAMALTLFAFNNTPQQYSMREAGGIRYSLFKKFIESSDEFYQCYGAFQTIVLSRVIVDVDQVTLTAQGIEILISKLTSEDRVACLTCSLLASLAHMRAGLADAMVSVGVLDMLVKKLSSEKDEMRNAAAVTLGYLTFNRTAYRLLFSVCRNTPILYEKIMDNIGVDPRINQDFIIDFKRAMTIGLPCQFQKISDARQLSSAAKKERKRPVTSDLQERNFNLHNRGGSAPTQLWMHGRALTVPSIALKPNYLQGRESTRLRPLSTSTNISSKTGSVKIKLSPHK